MNCLDFEIQRSKVKGQGHIKSTHEQMGTLLFTFSFTVDYVQR